MWTDPYIARQLLDLHLHPYHDIASRKRSTIEHTVNWIWAQSGQSGLKVLDLGCGPGLYAELLAEKGAVVTGLDFSSVSVDYARQSAATKQLKIDYRVENYLEMNFNAEFDLIILIYMDFCALLPDEREEVLLNVWKALKPGGTFIFDVVNEQDVEEIMLPASWDIEISGFWRPSPYIVLNQGYHFPNNKVLANHHVIIGEDDQVETYIFWTHYFNEQDLIPIFTHAGFEQIKSFEDVLPQNKDDWQAKHVTFYCAQKPNTGNEQKD